MQGANCRDVNNERIHLTATRTILLLGATEPRQLSFVYGCAAAAGAGAGMVWSSAQDQHQHGDTHQLLKSRCFRNEENHNGRCFSGLPRAVMAALEGIRAAPRRRGSRLPSLSSREHPEGRTWRDHVATRVYTCQLLRLKFTPSHATTAVVPTPVHAKEHGSCTHFCWRITFDSICAAMAICFCCPPPPSDASPYIHVWEAYFSSVSHEATPAASLTVAMFSYRGYSYPPIFQTALTGSM